MPFDLALSTRAALARELADAAVQHPDHSGLDALVRSAASALKADIASLSMLSDEQITVSGCGPADALPPRGTAMPFEDTICANALRTDEPLVIPNTAQDARVSSVPAVRDGHVGAYLGAPLRHPEGIVGVLCVVSSSPRAWSERDIETLDGIAAQVLDTLLLTAEA